MIFLTLQDVIASQRVPQLGVWIQTLVNQSVLRILKGGIIVQIILTTELQVVLPGPVVEHSAPGGAVQPAGSLQEHFQAAGLGKFPGLSNDEFSAGGTKSTPGQVHYHLKMYTEDASFRFQIADQLYRFLDLLCNASTQNPNWNADDGQTRLQQTVKGNGILRLQDAIRFPKETEKPWSFQRGYIPILTYLSSEWVVKSTMYSDVNFKDGNRKLSGKQVFKVIFVTMFEYITRFKQVYTTNPGVGELVTQVAGWFDEWAVAIKATPPFDDECSGYDEEMKSSILNNLCRDKERVLHLVRRSDARVVERLPSLQVRSTGSEGLIASLQRNVDYDGPGDLRELGKRHDNDHVDIGLIRIAPTRMELVCEDDPYLPANFAEAPHFLESNSIERLLDVQFRLLREEFVAPVRTAVQQVVSDLLKPNSVTTPLSKLITAGGGPYPTPPHTQDSVMFSVFTNVTFEPLALYNRGTTVGVEFDTPPGQARHRQAAVRAAYWEQAAKKRFMNGGLVALIWKTPTGELDIYVGTVTSSPRDRAELARKNRDRISIRVSLLDASAELRIVRAIQSHREDVGTRVLIEAPVFYEGVRPFLEALQTNPGSLPFSQYVCHQSDEELKKTQIKPPLYSLTPGFTFQLKDLFDSAAGVNSLTLTTNSTTSVALARSALVRGSRLDPSQADAIVDSLTREVSLVQGPPGTGKSYTCLELIRVLIKNQISPILLVAFTNHALDHMLKGILAANITQSIIRLGARQAADEKLAEFTLDKIEKSQEKTQLDRSSGPLYKEMKTTEEEMMRLMERISSRNIPSDHIKQHVHLFYPQHYEELFSNPPSWISTLIEQEADDGGEDWEFVRRRQNDLSPLGFWRSGNDLEFLRSPPSVQDDQNPTFRSIPQSANMFELLAEDSSEELQELDPPPMDERKAFLTDFFSQHGIEHTPNIPETERGLDELLIDPNVWNMSQISESTRATQVGDFEQLREMHRHTRRRFEEIKQQLVPQQGIEPKVMIVEEAGQVLESHIIASLVQSVQHLVMIGDPLQLRPNVNNYKLASDNPKTGMIYRFDRSLMERLSDGGFPMSQLDVQRRMRPAISSLIKNTLYPSLQDHPLVLEYPKVRGVHKDIFFVSHDNMEFSGGGDSVSKHNTYEVEMIHDLVLHLLRQGCYSNEGNIVILAAYLGQIPKIRKKLQGIVTTVVDERDSELLVQHGLDEEGSLVQQVEVSKRVLIRTLDNFQGEEGEIIILSLVRNAGTRFDERLSRAKHGMYIFGNAPEFAQGSGMWASVLQELYKSGSVGRGLPVQCHRHPDYIQVVDQPGQLQTVSPDGGCLRPCLAALPCGHQCPYKHTMSRTLFEVVPLTSSLRSWMLGVFKRAWGLSVSVSPDTASVWTYASGSTMSRKSCHFASTVPKCLATGIQLRLAAKSLAESCIPVALSPARRHAEHARHSTGLNQRSHKSKSLEPSIRDMTVGVFCPVGTVARKTALKTILAQALRPRNLSFDLFLTLQTMYAGLRVEMRTLPMSICLWNGLHQATLRQEVSERLEVWPPMSFWTLDSIVDLVMHVSLRELEDDDALDSMTITLPCQHVFTVETLDTVTRLNDFYERDETGEWVKATAPPYSKEIKAPPLCPTCRGPINSLRYGRVCKGSNVTIMQRNIASSLSRLLESANQKLSTSRTNFSASIISVITNSMPIPSALDASTPTSQEIPKKLDLALIREVDRPTPTEALRHLDRYHAHPQKGADHWRTAVGPILAVYQAARQIASKRDPSIQAYEASLTTLCKKELSNFGVDVSSDPPQEVEQYSLQLARTRIGQLPPRASLRFVVEAFWVTIDILVLLGLSTHEASNKVRLRESGTQNSSDWTKLAEFFFSRAVKDAEVALKLAESSESKNKAVKCQVILLQTQYQLAAHECRSATSSEATIIPETRAALMQLCENGIQAVQQCQSTIHNGYLRSCSDDEWTIRNEWINANFMAPSDRILDWWRQLKRSVESGTQCSVVTDEERTAILNVRMQESSRAVGLGHASHFYQCPNGHPYTIDETWFYAPLLGHYSDIISVYLGEDFGG
ncbi:hypothetical protein BDV93DRAFT_593821 [Ceratobasidium sp. AG-I]|nr:hypothetical protein BDV93DRAFT_593821 [Ceratobasidium sp. AG-I]